MYIDAEGTFRPQRLLQIADRYNDSLYLFPSLCLWNVHSIFMFFDTTGLDWMVLMYWKMLLMLEHITLIINHDFFLKQLQWWWKQGATSGGSFCSVLLRSGNCQSYIICLLNNVTEVHYTIIIIILNHHRLALLPTEGDRFYFISSFLIRLWVVL